MDSLLAEIKNCTLCQAHLQHGVNPVLSAHATSKVAIIGQAPGSVVHQSGIPWDDKSGERLRDWLGVKEEEFYNPQLFALIPMGFCYPGKGKSGDLPPRPECAVKWHEALMSQMNDLELILLIGSYAQKYYLGEKAKGTLTATVRNFNDYLPKHLPLPHPSPRNNIWLKKNPWFTDELLPSLKARVKLYL
ncbi:uracil-DNA glycosylase family protein [Reichenbachiella ulvae]|uniref:Uracil-DNA glycosylase family protein n=1 Tax=Reichenbachiella ulvae TaxID=2980104 RepID=A0ABT3CUM2_9BACT|nr:uracil-DNA glycosylase family protein [Reichenbachiella ulvae]MCV9387314.1 uracil-DNA glycosylase family protein [Reichenbachiella ulvae]